MKMTMGSLFDGSGGFPLAGTIGGIEPLWASEIEPFPIRVTTKRFPNMKHYGDVSKMNGAEIEPVDIIVGGSPCQDLSVAGKRKGMKRHCPECGYETEAQDEETLCPLCDTELKFTRSGMFMDMIRVIKEMREATNGKYPRFMLWENVPGAFSSNKGQDFKAVLEETIGVKREISLPRPPKDKWQNAGCIVGDGYSVAWRVVDAQYCGVPQRRRRIILIADFGSECAGEILFERYSLPRHFETCRDSWQRITTSAQDSFGATDIENGVNASCYNIGDRYSVPSEYAELSPTLTARCGTGGNNVPAVVHERDVYAVENPPNDSRVKIDETGTVAPSVTYALDRAMFNQGVNAQYEPQISDNGICHTLVAKGPNAVCASPEYIVRRLTPLECCRLQGFPDYWCSDLGTEEPTEEAVSFWKDVFETHSQIVNGKPSNKTDKQIIKWLKAPNADSAEYKMWGNGIALPCMARFLNRIPLQVHIEQKSINDLLD